MALVTKATDKSETHIFVCQCHSSHYIRVERDEEWGDCNWFEIDDHYNPRRWRDRITMAVKLLLGKECINSSFILDEKSAAEVIAALQPPHPTASVME